MTEESGSPLAPLLDEESPLRGEYRRRNSIWESIAIKASEAPAYEADGWHVHRTLKTKVRMQRLRSANERLRNKWWILLYKMGYQELSGENFRVLTKKGSVGKVEIDIFARDEETVVVSLCQTSDVLKELSLEARLSQLAAEKGEVASALKSFYGGGFKPKILWFFVTENVIWVPKDRDFSNREKIRIVTELELPYLSQLVDHLGHAARYQFLAEYLKDQKIPQLDDVKVPATRGRLGGEVFYSFVATPRQLLKIAFVNHRTLSDPEGYPTYQRLIQKPRLKQIGKFIENGGYFPNNLLVNFPKTPRFDVMRKDSVADVHHGILYLPNTYKSAWIIDGQHRLYGYANLPKRFLDEKVMVVAFDRMKPSEEAKLFVTINHEQRPVPKTLLDDLEGQLGWESEVPSERIGAIAARLVQQLARELGGPFYNRIIAEGIKSTDKVCLTVPSIKSALKRSGLLGRVVGSTYERGALCGGTDNATLVRALRVINGCFVQIMNADPERWDSGRKGRICNNEGVQAFTLLLGEIIAYLYKDAPEKALKILELDLLRQVTELLQPVLTFIRSGGGHVDALFTVPFGSGGPKEYFFRLSKLVRSEFPDFAPPDYGDWEAAQSEEDRHTADQQIQEINATVQRHIFRVFREIYGEGQSRYWEKGVPNADMRSAAYRRSCDYDVDDRGPLEAYLDFIDLKKIIEKSDRWPMFKDVLHIPLDGEKGSAKAVSWMDRVNELRRISAHAGDGRKYKVSDFSLINHLHETITSRVKDYDYSKWRTAVPEEN